MRLLYAVAAACCVAASAPAQVAVSIRAGLIYHVEGEAWVGERLLDPKAKRFEHLALDDVLRTGRGSTEVSLGVGRMLRLAPRTEIALRDDRLEAVAIEVLRGSIYVAWSEISGGRGGVIAVRTGDAGWEASRPGRYRWDAPGDAAPLLRVFNGKARAQAGGSTLIVKSKREAVLADGVEMRSLDETRSDAFDRWNSRRTRIVARKSRAGQIGRRMRSGRVGPVGGGGGSGGGGGGRGLPGASQPNINPAREP